MLVEDDHAVAQTLIDALESSSYRVWLAETGADAKILLEPTSPDEILSRDDLATLVWGYQDASSGRTIDVHIRRLRVKLSSGPVPAPAIVAVRGFGYKMAVEEASGANGAAA